MIKLVKENWNVCDIIVVNIGKTAWVIHSSTGLQLQLPEQFCQGKPPRKKLWHRHHKVILDKIGPYVVGVTINGKRIYLLEEAQYPRPVILYLQDMEEETNNFLAQIPPVVSDDLSELPLFMNIRENFLSERLPQEEIWQKRLALELVICRSIQKICFRHAFQTHSDIEKTNREEIKRTLIEVCPSIKGYEKLLDLLIYETKEMLKAYIEDCWLSADSIDKAFDRSKFLPYENSFVPKEFSLDQIKSYISLLNM